MAGFTFNLNPLNEDELYAIYHQPELLGWALRHGIYPEGPQDLDEYTNYPFWTYYRLVKSYLASPYVKVPNEEKQCLLTGLNLTLWEYQEVDDRENPRLAALEPCRGPALFLRSLKDMRYMSPSLMYPSVVEQDVFEGVHALCTTPDVWGRENNCACRRCLSHLLDALAFSRHGRHSMMFVCYLLYEYGFEIHNLLMSIFSEASSSSSSPSSSLSTSPSCLLSSDTGAKSSSTQTTFTSLEASEKWAAVRALGSTLAPTENGLVPREPMQIPLCTNQLMYRSMAELAVAAQQDTFDTFNSSHSAIVCPNCSTVIEKTSAAAVPVSINHIHAIPELMRESLYAPETEGIYIAGIARYMEQIILHYKLPMTITVKKACYKGFNVLMTVANLAPKATTPSSPAWTSYGDRAPILQDPIGSNDADFDVMNAISLDILELNMKDGEHAVAKTLLTCIELICM